ncbi:YbhN family protein [Arthrobacter sp. SDTb3-6]|uniref:lysylphosphatidylglycerol synthase transmembrane domain-containing protein n=1 Tax=Arthrobacter sp. SDTb3-6 TaxID=2713571 RepID=UPI00159E56E9|nr:UPF0104 family protein [Arthrobacter sp. SDTb3-6]
MGAVPRPRQPDSTCCTAPAAALAALLATGAGLWFLTQRTELALGMVRALADYVPFVSADSASSFLRTRSEQVRHMAGNPRRLAISLVCAILNWDLDAEAVWVVLAALGPHLGIGPLLTVYGAGNILATLPLTLGGLGFVEGVMVRALPGFATPAGATLLGVPAWRLLEFWLPFPLGALAYMSVGMGEGAVSIHRQPLAIGNPTGAQAPRRRRRRHWRWMIDIGCLTIRGHGYN